MRTKTNTRVAAWLALAMGIAAAGGTAQATAVFSKYQMPANTTNVATISLAEAILVTSSQLAYPGPNTFNIVYAFFTPTDSGVYSIGIADASYDPVLLIYEGQTSFPSSDPSSGILALNDDGLLNEFKGLAFSNTLGFPSLNPVLQDLNLTAGTTYMLGATSFSAGDVIPLPLEFFVYGAPVSIGTSSLAVVPEPSSLGLLALGAGGLLARRRRAMAA